MATEWADLPAGLNDPARRLVREMRAAKDAAGLSLAHLAAYTHYSRASWERWLNGKRLVTPTALAGFARQTGIDGGALAELLGRASLEGGSEPLPPTGAATRRAGAVVAQLPAAIPDFTGRSAQIESMISALTRQEPARAGQTPVLVVCAGGGFGKTALAVHVANRLAEQYPDGALYVDLRGVDRDPRDPADVLASWLRALGDGADAIPASLEDRAGRFRSLVRDRALLVLLDNAHDAAQIRPLIPATGRGAVIVTSRAQLAHLPAALRISLDPMTYSESLELLETIAGASRIGREPQATAAVLDACAGLPLALRICAARLETRPSWSVRTLADRVSGEHRRLDELSVGDLAPRSTFEMSYAQLPDGADGAAEPGEVSPARAFRLLGLARLPEIGLLAASALFGVDPDRAEYALETLVDAHLLESPAPERYRFHDLIGLYAAERGETEPEAERTAAVRRVASWYLYADETAIAHLGNVPPPPAPDGLLLRTPEIGFPGRAEALAWLDAEFTALVGIGRLAERHALHDVAVHLPGTLLHYADLRGAWEDFEAVNEIALRAARAAGDRRSEASALNGLGWAYQRTNQPERAMALMSQALEIFESVDRLSGQASTLELMATVAELLGDEEGALAFQRRALEIRRRISGTDPHQLLVSTANVALQYASMRRDKEFFELGEEALATARARSLWPVVAALLEAAGEVHLAHGRVPEALAALTESVELYTELDAQPSLADALEYLGNAYAALDDRERAAAAWTTAVDIFESCDPPRAEAIRERLRGAADPVRARDRSGS